jgi:MOSC domain-containing protein YiiM
MRRAGGGSVVSVNIGGATPIAAKSGFTGIDKRPVDGPVWVSPPGPKGVGGSGLAGDTVVDRVHHGGDDQAVYAYSREDLDWWQARIGRSLPSGGFGENLTTAGMDVSAAVIGERWLVGDEVELAVTLPRIPCRTFAAWLREHDWIHTFRTAARPGAYLRVERAGAVRPGAPVTVTSRPDHGVTVATLFRAFTTQPELVASLASGGDEAVVDVGRALTDVGAALEGHHR